MYGIQLLAGIDFVGPRNAPYGAVTRVFCDRSHLISQLSFVRKQAFVRRIQVA
jgi:hypothetical protein